MFSSLPSHAQRLTKQSGLRIKAEECLIYVFFPASADEFTDHYLAPAKPTTVSYVYMKDKNRKQGKLFVIIAGHLEAKVQN